MRPAVALLAGVALLAAGALPLRAARADAAVCADLAAHVAAVLAAAAEAAPTRAEALAAELLAPGREVAPHLVEALLAEAAAPRSPAAIDALRLAAARLAPVVLRTELAARVEPPPSAAARVEVLRLLGARGGARDLRLVVDFAAPAPPEAGVDPRVGRALEGALEGLLARDAAALGYVPSALRAAPVELRPYLVRAAAESGRPAAFTQLGRLLAADPDLDRIVLPFLPRAAIAAPRPLDAGVLREVRGRLLAVDRLLQRSAAQAAGALQDGAAVPLLVELLADPDPTLRAVVHAALQRLTDLRLPAAPERWSAWLASEQAWGAAQGGRACEALRSADVGEVLAALRELGEHRLERERWTRHVAEVVDHPHAPLRRSACATLRRLGSPAALPSLVEALSDPDPAVVAEAHGALRALTGHQLPPDPGAWDDLLPPAAPARELSAVRAGPDR